MELSLYEIYKELKFKRIILCYSGPIAQASIEGVGSTLRRNLEIEEAGNTTKLSVFSMFIEQVQNVLNYSAEKLSKTEEDGNELRIGVSVIGYEENGDYFIYCGNRVYNYDIPRISESIEQVRNLSKDELKLLYKERRRMEPQPGSKGAGLGIIEMARKSVIPLEYSLVKIDEEFSFFSIKVVVGRH
ncbi:MAG: hypothetical protein CVU87_01980 [Firmicutes bacterium HGW-Firmicutes-12]|nr:MAG: hypothetical protein CVU87_01980 [Firmicutes bacterium HGW-Firmicutes-12]